MNLYGMVGNNPLSRIDALGLAGSVVGLPAQIPILIESGWTAAEIAEVFGVGILTAEAWMIANELAKQVEKSIENFQNNAKGKDPCEKAKNAVKQAQKGIQNSLKRIAEHEAKISNPSAYLEPGVPAKYGISVRTTQLAAQKKGLEITEKALAALEKAADIACRCWHKPWIWF